MYWKISVGDLVAAVFSSATAMEISCEWQKSATASINNEFFMARTGSREDKEQ